jgi:glyoxylase-like metal-dependent hydrolase (beta-lactamase superfamily II)
VTKPFELYAIRLATVDRPARDNFLNDPSLPGMMRMDFDMWIARNEDRIVAIDCGFDVKAGRRRNRTLDRQPRNAVQELGIDPADVTDLVVTHLHYDHAGNLGDFPNAKIWIQEKELAYVSGPSMRHSTLSHFFETDDVCGVVRESFAGRVRQINGDVEIASGLELFLVGGHTPGLQMVRVLTERGEVLLASDALHYFDNLRLRNPFPGIVNVADMMDGYERIEELAADVDHIVPGHDPLVMERYRNSSLGLAEGIVALHLEPVQQLDSRTRDRC